MKDIKSDVRRQTSPSDCEARIRCLARSFKRQQGYLIVVIAVMAIVVAAVAISSYWPEEQGGAVPGAIDVTPTPTATPTSEVKEASSDATPMVPMKEESITFFLTEDSEFIVDVKNERIGYGETIKFNGGVTRSVAWQDRTGNYDIADASDNWRMEIDWINRECKPPFKVPASQRFPETPTVDGTSTPKAYGHIQFQ